MITPLDEATEAVAIAQREVYVADSLSHEYRNKMRMADEELSAANRRLTDARVALEQVVLDRHADVHGHLLVDEDRSEFEKRWDAKMNELRAKREFFNKKMADKEKETDDLLVEMQEGLMPVADVRRALLKRSHPDHPDHVHEDCCK